MRYPIIRSFLVVGLFSFYSHSLVAQAPYVWSSSDGDYQSGRPVLTVSAYNFDSIGTRFLSVTDELRNFNGIVLIESEAAVSFPMLPSIFFDSASSEIPSRYHRYSTQAETEEFTEDGLAHRLLDSHYEVLNVLGSRLRADTGLTMRIIGTASCAREPGEDSSMGRARAESVYQYLREVWGIPARQLVVERGYDCPSFRWNPNTPVGRAANRRVEFVRGGDSPRNRETTFESEDWRLFHAISDSIRIVRPYPGKLEFTFVPAIPDSAIDHIRFAIFHNDTLYRFITLDEVRFVYEAKKWYRSGDTSEPENLYRWVDDVFRNGGESGLQRLAFQLIVTDTLGHEHRSSRVEIPVRTIGVREGREVYGTERVATLIYMLPDRFRDRPMFGDRPENYGEIQRSFVSQLSPTTRIDLTSTTDTLGLHDRNLRMSQHLVSDISRYLARTDSVKATVINATGLGEWYPRFSNEYPEGSMFNIGIHGVIERLERSNRMD